MMKTFAHSFVAAFAVICGVIWMQPASAVPQFARKYDMNCNSCHTAFPQLNSTGRAFKEAGYRFPSAADQKDLEVSDFLHLEKYMPLSGVLVSRPYDKKDSGDEKVRAIHEVEVIAAGIIGRQWSGYFELEAEDEDNFEPSIKPAVLTYSYRPELNVMFSYAPIFWADPYGILGDHFRLTQAHLGVIDQTFGGADGAVDSATGDINAGKLRTTRQNVGIFGRLAERVFYNVNWSGEAQDTEGENASTISGILDFDITQNVMVGAFGMSGQNENTTGSDLDYSRYGLQFQADVSQARVQAVWLTANDDNVSGVGDQDNDAYSIQGFWTFQDSTMRPTVVPVVRFDHYEQNDGNDEFDSATLNLGYYFTQNVKGFLEYSDVYDAPTSDDEDHRFSIELIAAF